MIVLFFFEIIKVQIVKNGNLYNFFKKYQLPLQLSPLKRKIHPSLRPVAPKRKKKTTTITTATTATSTYSIYGCKRNVWNQVLIYQYCFTKGLVTAIFGEEKKDIELAVFKETIKEIKKIAENE